MEPSNKEGIHIQKSWMEENYCCCLNEIFHTRHDKMSIGSYYITGNEWGVTTSRATSGHRKNDPNTSGQRWNNFHTSYIDRSFVVSGNNRVVKPKCKQFTSLNKMLSNSKVLIVHISFTALINNEGIGGIRKVPRRIKCTFCSCRKQSCCKAEMLPSYTSLLKKLSNFPQALTGTILLMLY